MRYRYYEFTDKPTGNKCVAAVSTFGGQDVRAVARCNVNDTYDVEFGKKLAKAKLDVKIAKKRIRYANRRVNEALKDIDTAKRQLDKMTTYKVSAMNEFREVENNLLSIVSSLTNN